MRLFNLYQHLQNHGKGASSATDRSLLTRDQTTLLTIAFSDVHFNVESGSLLQAGVAHSSNKKVINHTVDGTY